jgi:hypothetical protein
MNILIMQNPPFTCRLVTLTPFPSTLYSEAPLNLFLSIHKRDEILYTYKSPGKIIFPFYFKLLRLWITNWKEILSPQGRCPKMGTRSRWKTGGPHYIFAISLSGRRAPEDKAPRGNVWACSYTNRYPNNKINTEKYIKLNRKIYNNETKKNI